MGESSFGPIQGGGVPVASDGIAVVGLAGRFPGARDVATFWANLCAGVESITTLDEGALDDAFDAATRGSSAYVKARGLLADVDRFDAAFFGISPREAEAIDPQHRIMLETAWEALEDAGLDPAATAARIGVIAGCSIGTYFLRHVMRDRATIEGFVSDYQVGSFPELLGSGSDFFATRIAYKLDLRGPALTVQSACSTGLLAIAQAAGMLRARQADVMLAGAVSVSFPQQRGYLHQVGGMVSSDGHCRTFDAQASGTVFGDGAGVVVLKRLADARADGDRIYAVLRGVGITNDGAAKVGYSAPSVAGQAAAIAAAYRDAGLEPGAIDYVECHGTATPLGDPIEIAGLAAVYGGSTGARCAIGSVKPNVGHLDVAAGMAGFIKTALAVYHGTLPPTINFTAPNPHIDFAATPFDVHAELGPWPARGERRRAAVSAFGVGGTNVHVVIEDEPEPAHEAGPPQPELVLVSGRTPAALARNVGRLAAHLGAAGNMDLGDVAATSQARRAFGYRHAVRAATVGEAAAELTALASGRGAERNASAGVDVAFLFPGQGSQFVGMGRELYASRAAFRDALDRCAEIARPHLGSDLREALFPAIPGESATQALTATDLAQPAIFAVSYALAELWRSLGVTAIATAGHSVGEFVAATLAGVFSLEDALRVVVERGRLMAALAPGAMLAVRLGEAELAAILPSDLSIAALNSPMQSVVAGPHAAIAAFEARLAELETPARRVATSHAFHSSMMEPIREPLAALVGSLTLHAPVYPYVSTVTGTWIEADEALAPSYWAEHALRPVRFADALATLVEAGVGAFLEVGPGTALSTNARQAAPREAGCAVATTLIAGERPGGEVGGLLDALGVLWTCGVAAPNWAALRDGRSTRHLSLPTYAFEPTRHWIEAPESHDTPVETLDVNAPLPAPDDTPAQSLRELEDDLTRLLCDLSGETVRDDERGSSFLELGFDSLFLGRYVAKIRERFGVDVAFRSLLGELPSLRALAEHVLAVGPPRVVAAPVPTPSPTAVNSSTTPGAPIAVATTSADGASTDGTYAAVVRAQLDAMAQLMREQLAALESAPVAAPPATSPPTTPVVVALTSLPVAPAPAAPERATEEPSRFDAFKVRGATSGDLTPEQRRHVDELIARVTGKTAKSKAFTQRYRRVLADPRVAAGFRSDWKEMVYPIVCERAAGSRMWDLDGNEYVDILNGFGQTAFGHAPDFVVASVAEQIERGFAIGPQAERAGDVAERFCAMTGNERMTFCNTGSEAVMAAMRLARTVTGRDRIVVFGGAYHGQFDEVLVKGARTSTRSIPVAPGIPNDSVANITVLPYATPESLAWVREHANELAAVIVEPVQSRHPALQPREFLHDLRAIATASGTALVFDEVVTGFRMHPGGMQAIFGVRADLATYGKVVGGGMPIGILAGNERFMDALDGGMWQYGDDSVPEVSPTFFAGTFVRHPLVVAAVDAVLRHLEAHGPELQASLTARTARLVERLNADFERRGMTSRIETFGSLFYVNFIAEERFAGLLYYHLRDRGVYIQEGFPCFLTTAHTEADVDLIVRAFAESLDALQSVGIFGQRVTPVVESEREPAEIELTEEQTEVYLAAQLGDDASCAFNESVTVRLAGALDATAFERAFDFVVDRHEALRSSYGVTGEVMRIAAQSSASLNSLDVSGGAAEDELAAAIARDARTPFDLARGPLVRGTLVRLGEADHALIFTAHHIVCDGWSINVILGEFARAYDAFARGATPALPQPLAFRRYADDARTVGAATRERAQAYWHAQYAAPTRALDLPLDRPRAEIRSFAGGTRTAHVSAERYRALKKSGALKGATLFTTLFAGFGALAGRLANASDVVIGVPAAGQAAYEGETLVGHCVNFLPIRLRFSADAPFATLLADAKKSVLDAYDHQTYTLGTLVRTLAVPRERNRLPLTEIQFNLERLADGLAGGGVSFEIAPNPKAYVNFDLFFNVVESQDGLRIDCDYNAALYDAATIDRWLAAYGAILDAIATDPATPVSAFEIPSAPVATVPVTNTLPKSEPYAYATFVAAFEASVDARPDAVAVSCGERSITYAELDRRSNRLAHYLMARVGTGRLVAIAVERSMEMLVALLGTLKAGCAYLPLDAAHPAARLRFILEDSSAAALIFDATCDRELASAVVAGIDLVRDAESIGKGAPTRPATNLDGASLAYTIYTSGSTGRPKGVEIEHHSLLNLLESMAERPGLAREDVFVAVTTIAFDIAALELFLPLAVGARVVIARSTEVGDGFALAALLRDNGATAMQSTPATWRLLLEAGFRSPVGFRMLCGGEALRHDVADSLLAGAGTLWNMYGPTETTIWSSCGRVSPSGTITVGTPARNTRFYVLDEADKPVAAGVVGQLHIAGDGVARGYVNLPERTTDVFISDPFSGGRMYRTGDAARALPNGEYEIVGRLDAQVKIRGYRVELGEIETLLAQNEELAASAVALRRDRSGEDRLVGYYIARSGQAVVPQTLVERLAETLPTYMVPTAWVALDALPLSPNGKLDRAALPQPDDVGATIAVSAATNAPTTATEIALATIWREVLGLERVASDDDLFKLGADSIQLFKITARANRQGLPIVAKSLFTLRTLGAVARAIDASAEREHAS